MDFFLRIKIFLGYVLIVVIIFSFWKVLSYSRLELLKLENIIMKQNMPVKIFIKLIYILLS